MQLLNDILRAAAGSEKSNLILLFLCAASLPLLTFRLQGPSHAGHLDPDRMLSGWRHWLGGLFLDSLGSEQSGRVPQAAGGFGLARLRCWLRLSI